LLKLARALADRVDSLKIVASLTGLTCLRY